MTKWTRQLAAANLLDKPKLPPVGSYQRRKVVTYDDVMRLAHSLGLISSYYFRVTPQRDGSTIIEFFDPEREAAIREWFTLHGVEVRETITQTYILRTTDDNLALMAKLTWGGAK